MRRTRWTTVLVCTLATGVLSWVVTDLLLRRQGWVPELAPWGGVVALVIAVVVLVAGLAVRRLRAHEPTWMTPTGAATTASAAQASAVVGSLVGGAYAGQLAVVLTNAAAPALTQLGWTAAGCFLACAVWVAIGLLVEHWCAIDMSDDDDDGTKGRGGSGGSVPPGGAPA